jgi:hypothetical protein
MKNILKLEYEKYYDDDDDIECYCEVSNFIKCYFSPIIHFFIYKLSIVKDV